MAISIFNSIPVLIDPSAAYVPATNSGVAAYDGKFALGGYRAKNKKIAHYRPHFQANGFRLFNDVIAGGGETLHRAIFFETSTTLASPLTVWLGLGAATSNNGQCTMALAVDSAAANVKATVIVEETSVPSGPVFSAPTTFGGGLSLGTLTAGQSRALWVRRITAGSPTTSQNDFFTINYSVDGGVTVETLLVWWHFTVGVTMSVTRDQIGQKITKSNGCTFTVSTVTAPPGDKVFVQITTTTRDTVYASSTPITQTQTFLDECKKTATGTFTYQFKPANVGHYRFVFDCGEEEVVQDLVVSI